MVYLKQCHKPTKGQTYVTYNIKDFLQLSNFKSSKKTCKLSNKFIFWSNVSDSVKFRVHDQQKSLSFEVREANLTKNYNGHTVYVIILLLHPETEI